MFLHQSGQRQSQQRRQAFSDRHRSDRQCYVDQTLDRFQQTRHATMFALGQDLQTLQMQIHQETRTAVEQVTAQRQLQATHLMLRLADFPQRLRQQTAELLSMPSTDRALLAEQISQELSEFHANLTTAVAALRHMSQQQIEQLKTEPQEVLQTYQPEQIQQQLQLVQDLADYIAILQAEVKNQLIELSLIRQARSRQAQQMLQSSRDRRLADIAELRADLQSFCSDLHWIIPGETGTS